MSNYLDSQRATEQALRKTLESLTSITAESLVRTEVLGTSLDFRDGVEIFSQTLGLFRSLAEAKLDNVPKETLSNLDNLAKTAFQHFQQVLAFDPGKQANPAAERDRLIQQVAQQYSSQFSSVAPILAYSVRKGTDFDLLERNARAALGEIANLRNQTEERAGKLIAEAQTVVEQVKRAAAEVGVAQHAVHFKREAEGHLKRSKVWLAVTAALALITFAYSGVILVFFSIRLPSLSGVQSLQLAIAKVLVFSILYLAVIWAGRIYRAQWHNYIINQHRQNALSTFETFVKAAGDDQTKGAVLLQTTQAIFTPQTTGFVTQESDTVGPAQVLEIFRTATASKPS
jgi:hypothetical protein